MYAVDTDTVIHLERDTGRLGGPGIGFTHRACIDTLNRKMYLFAGTSRGESKNINVNEDDNCGLKIWAWSLEDRRWEQIKTSKGQSAFPVPRFAHQIAMDPESRTFYLFGGNPGVDSKSGTTSNVRLDDFWELHIQRQLGSEDILRRGLFLVRKQQ